MRSSGTASIVNTRLTLGNGITLTSGGPIDSTRVDVISTKANTLCSTVGNKTLASAATSTVALLGFTVTVGPPSEYLNARASACAAAKLITFPVAYTKAKNVPSAIAELVACELPVANAVCKPTADAELLAVLAPCADMRPTISAVAVLEPAEVAVDCAWLEPPAVATDPAVEAAVERAWLEPPAVAVEIAVDVPVADARVVAVAAATDVADAVVVLAAKASAEPNAVDVAVAVAVVVVVAWPVAVANDEAVEVAVELAIARPVAEAEEVATDVATEPAAAGIAEAVDVAVAEPTARLRASVVAVADDTDEAAAVREARPSAVAVPTDVAVDVAVDLANAKPVAEAIDAAVEVATEPGAAASPTARPLIGPEAIGPTAIPGNKRTCYSGQTITGNSAINSSIVGSWRCPANTSCIMLYAYRLQLSIQEPNVMPSCWKGPGYPARSEQVIRLSYCFCCATLSKCSIIAASYRLIILGTGSTNSVPVHCHPIGVSGLQGTPTSCSQEFTFITIPFSSNCACHI